MLEGEVKTSGIFSLAVHKNSAAEPPVNPIITPVAIISSAPIEIKKSSFESLITSFKSIFSRVFDKIDKSKVANSTIDFFSSVFKDPKKAATEEFNNLKDATSNTIKDPKKAATDLFSGFSNLKDSLFGGGSKTTSSTGLATLGGGGSGGGSGGGLGGTLGGASDDAAGGLSVGLEGLAGAVGITTAALVTGGVAIIAAVVAIAAIKPIANEIVKDLSDFASALLSAPAVIEQFVAPFKSMVEAFNPGLIDRYNLQIQNLAASLGRAFQPVIEYAGKFADHLNVLITDSSEFRNMFRLLAKGVFDVAVILSNVFMPIINTIVNEFNLLLPDITNLGRGIANAISIFSIVLIPVVKALGIVFSHVINVVQVLLPMFAAIGTALVGLGGIIMMGLLPIITILMAPMIILGTLFKLLATGVTSVLISIKDFIKSIPVIGKIFKDEEAKGPKTIAAQPASTVSLEDIGLQARLAAFSQGTSIAEKQLFEAEKANGILEAIKRALLMGSNTQLVASAFGV